MKAATFKLEVPDEMTFEQLVSSCEKGSKLVAYLFLIPRPIFPPIQRVSKIFLVNPDEHTTHSIKYNLINLIWGWWGLPFGPVFTYTAIKQNRTGIDFTEDVLANLDKENFAKRMVAIKKAGTLYIYPDNGTLKVFKKGFEYYKEHFGILERKPIIGKFIDTEEPYYVIGLSDVDYVKMENIKKSMYEFFYSHFVIECINIDDNAELSSKLKKQGLEIDH
jgi:hypothetical protein